MKQTMIWRKVNTVFRLIVLAAFFMLLLLAVKLNSNAADSNEADSNAAISNEADSFSELCNERDIWATLFLTDGYGVREYPDEISETVCTLPSGQSVRLIGVDDAALLSLSDMSGIKTLWYEAEIIVGEDVITGYINRKNLAISDERFLEWEKSICDDFISDYDFTYKLEADDSQTGESIYEDVEQFPDSYRQYLYELKALHPNWIFVRMDTGLDWTNSINVESSIIGDRSWTDNKNYYYHAEQKVLQSRWYHASPEAVAYYMDPRNFIDESHIFMFEQLTFNESYHTPDSVSDYLKGTFMDSDKGNAPGTDKAYSDILYNAGKENGVSPFHLSARLIQEQGSGNSPLISGKYPGFEGYYNYFNISASGSTDTEVIVNGLTYAKNKGWTDAEKSISGGSGFLLSSYIKCGQDSLYLQKYNVNPLATNAVYSHQYMQNIAAPYYESVTTKNQYASSGALDKAFIFKIPVFENMPAYPCPKPHEVGFEGASVSVGGKLYFSYYVNIPSILTQSNTQTGIAPYMFMVDGDNPGNVMAVKLLSMADYDYDRGCYKYTFEMDAKEMTRKVTAYFYYWNIDAGGNYSELVKAPEADYAGINCGSYSIQDYVAAMLGEPEYYADVIPTAKAMLRYGACAQRILGYRTDALADSILEPEEELENSEVRTQLVGELECYEEIINEDASGELAFVGARLILKDEVTLKLYFSSSEYSKAIEGGNESSFGQYLNGSVSNTTKSVSTQLESDYIVVSVIGLTPVDWNDTYLFSVTDTNTGAEINVSYSVFSYLYNAICEAAGENYYGLAKSMFDFSCGCE